MHSRGADRSQQTPKSKPKTPAKVIELRISRHSNGCAPRNTKGRKEFLVEEQ
ncbi:hypothetical protein CERSUDRAFT_100099 [Gelatoporia subvermispora B]|uniref:Uncharacterized protein n=1 Tax=Ceriporiopsis subvermispora (strain B) TaxID=914234 RepID=M2Q4Y8_CERS8|nr:hypothetical protein CERSUDRAFT_100099 [Gelatoporia subvermispora B]